LKKGARNGLLSGMRTTKKAAFKAHITRKLNRQIENLDPVRDIRSIAAFKAHATRRRLRLG